MVSHGGDVKGLAASSVAGLKGNKMNIFIIANLDKETHLPFFFPLFKNRKGGNGKKLQVVKF